MGRKKFKIIKNLTKCITSAPDEGEVGDIFSVSFTVDGINLGFSEPPKATWDGGEKVGVLDDPPLNMTCHIYEIQVNDPVDEITLTAEAVSTTPPATEFQINTVFSHCTSDAPATGTQNKELTVTITADTGYKFEGEPPYVTWVQGRANAVISPDGLTATLTFTVTNTSTAVYIYATAAPERPPYVDKYGIVNIYKTTVNELIQFAQARFYKDGQNYVDLGQYIVKLHKVYCAVTNATLENTPMIRCGRYNTKIRTHVPEFDIVELNFGTRQLAMATPNDLASKLTIFLPFVGEFEIDPAYVFNKFVKVLYKVNIVQGSCVAQVLVNDTLEDQANITTEDQANITTEDQANITTEENAPYPLIIKEGNISNNILFRTYDSFSGDVGNDSNVLKGMVPYILWKKFPNQNTNVTHNISLNTPLIKCKGWNSFDNITGLSGIPTKDEYNMIIDQLTRGVIL